MYVRREGAKGVVSTHTHIYIYIYIYIDVQKNTDDVKISHAGGRCKTRTYKNASFLLILILYFNFIVSFDYLLIAIYTTCSYIILNNITVTVYCNFKGNIFLLLLFQSNCCSKTASIVIEVYPI